jgi:ankyrin repeat protein
MNKQDFANAISEFILDPIGKKIVRPAVSSPRGTEAVPTPPPPLIKNNGTNAQQQPPIVSTDQKKSAEIINQYNIEEAKKKEVLQNNREAAAANTIKRLIQRKVARIREQKKIAEQLGPPTSRVVTAKADEAIAIAEKNTNPETIENLAAVESDVASIIDKAKQEKQQLIAALLSAIVHKKPPVLAAVAVEQEKDEEQEQQREQDEEKDEEQEQEQEQEQQQEKEQTISSNMENQQQLIAALLSAIVDKKKSPQAQAEQAVAPSVSTIEKQQPIAALLSAIVDKKKSPPAQAEQATPAQGTEVPTPAQGTEVPTPTPASTGGPASTSATGGPASTGGPEAAENVKEQQYDAYTRLLMAILDNNDKEVDIILSNEKNPELLVNKKTYDEDGYTPLLLATMIGNAKIIRMLIKNGAEVDDNIKDVAKNKNVYSNSGLLYGENLKKVLEAAVKEKEYEDEKKNKKPLNVRQQMEDTLAYIEKAKTETPKFVKKAAKETLKTAAEGVEEINKQAQIAAAGLADALNTQVYESKDAEKKTQSVFDNYYPYEGEDLPDGDENSLKIGKVLLTEKDFKYEKGIYYDPVSTEFNEAPLQDTETLKAKQGKGSSNKAANKRSVNFVPRLNLNTNTNSDSDYNSDSDSDSDSDSRTGKMKLRRSARIRPATAR